ncbi:terminase small subunit [Escherichia coli]|nr:terminase small subunit [Escherichia coli]GDU09487.1 terminase small subunit [Escherichia coli]
MCFDVVNAKNVNDIKWFCKNTWLLYRFLSMAYGEEMAFLLNKSDMASSIGISVQAFDKWGVPPVERRGREVFYDVKTVLEIDRERRQHNQRIPDDEGDLEERLLRARAELTEEQAVAQKLKNQVTEGKLIDTGFCIFALSKLAMALSSTLDSIPLSMQRQFPDLTPRHLDHRKRLVRTVLIFTESSDQLSRATDRVPGLPASPGYVQ